MDIPDSEVLVAKRVIRNGSCGRRVQHESKEDSLRQLRWKVKSASDCSPYPILRFMTFTRLCGSPCYTSATFPCAR